MDPSKTPPPQEAKLHFLDYWRIIRIRKTVILAVFLLVVITATLVTFILPESFSSKARIKVERDQTDISGVMGNQPMLGVYDPYFIQTEFEVIQSEVILGDVIKDLNLQETWGKKYNNGQPFTRTEAMTWIKNHLDLRPVRNTSLIEIVYYSESPQEASDLANKIAETYRKHRVQERQSLTQGGIKALEERIGEQERTVDKQQQVVDDLRDKLKISDPLGSSEAPTMMLSAETLRHIEGIRIESQAEFVGAKTLLDSLRSLPPDKLAQALPTTGVQDSLLSGLLEQLTLADQKLVAAEKQLGPKNTEYATISAQVDDINKKIRERVNGIVLGLDIKAGALQQRLIDLSNEVTAATQKDINKSTESRPYWEAKRKLEEYQRFRQVLYMKIASEKTELDLPRASMVEIVDRAVPGIKPVRPNKTLNIALGIIIGLVVGVGLAFFI